MHLTVVGWMTCTAFSSFFFSMQLDKERILPYFVRGY